MIEHSVFYIGSTHIQLHSLHSADHLEVAIREANRSNEEKVIDQIENAQLAGALAKDARGMAKVLIRISEHGLQIVDPATRNTKDRIPLLNVVFTVSYDDGFGRFNSVVVERPRGGGDAVCRCHLLQSEFRTAEQLCIDIDELFYEVQSKCLNFDQNDPSTPI